MQNFILCTLRRALKQLINNAGSSHYIPFYTPTKLQLKTKIVEEINGGLVSDMKVILEGIIRRVI